MIETWWGVLLILFMVSFLKLTVDLFCIFKWFHYLDLLLHHFLLNVVSIVQGFKPIWHICWVPHVLWCLPVIRWVSVISSHVFDLSWAQMLMCSLFSGITTCEVQLVLKPRTIKQKLSSLCTSTRECPSLDQANVQKRLVHKICLYGRLNRSITVVFTGDSLSCQTSADKWDVKDNKTWRGATVSSWSRRQTSIPSSARKQPNLFVYVCFIYLLLFACAKDTSICAFSF